MAIRILSNDEIQNISKNSLVKKIDPQHLTLMYMMFVKYRN